MCVEFQKKTVGPPYVPLIEFGTKRESRQLKVYKRLH